MADGKVEIELELKADKAKEQAKKSGEEAGKGFGESFGKGSEQGPKKAATALEKLNGKIKEQKAELASLKTQLTNVVLEHGKDSDKAQELASRIAELNSDLERNESTLKEAASAADQYGKEVGEAAKDAEKLGDSAKGTEKLGEGIAGFAKKAVGVLAAVGIADKLKDIGVAAVNAAADVAAETSAFEQIMGDYSVEAQAKMHEVAEATGVTDTRLASAMTSMTAKFKGLGYGIEEATDLATRGLTLSSDAAAFWDISLQDAQGALNSFINGNYEGGEAIGLFANETQLAAYAADQGIDDWQNLSEAEKQAIRLEYAENMMALSGATGQAAKEADQFANVMGNLKENWWQFLAIVGDPILENLVVPIIEELSNAFDQLRFDIDAGQFVAAGQTIANGLTGIIDVILANVPGFLSAGVELVGGLLLGIVQNIPHLVTSVVDAVTTAIPMILESLFTVATAIVEALPEITQSIVEAIPEIVQMIADFLPETLDVLVEGVTALVQALVEALPEIVQVIAEALPDMVTSIVEALVECLPQMIEGFVQLFLAFVEAVPLIIEAIVPYIPDIVEGIVTALVEAMPILIDGFVQLFLAIVDALPQIIEAITPYMPEIVTAIVFALLDAMPILIQGFIDLFLAIVKALPTILVKVAEAAVKVVNRIVEQFQHDAPKMKKEAENMFRKFVDGIKSKIPDIQRAVGEIPGKIKNALGDLGGMLVESGRSLIDGLTAGIRSGISGAIAAVKSGLSEIRSYFPFSPAKKGPFSGHGYTTFSGRAIMRDLAKGIDAASSYPVDAVHRALGDARMSFDPNAQIAGSFVRQNAAAYAAAAGSVSHSTTNNDNHQVINFNAPVRSPRQVARELRMQRTYGLAATR